MQHNHFRFTCLKTGSYAVMHFVIAIIVAYAITRDWRAALAVGMIEPVVQTIAFMFHDRFWSRRAAQTVAAADPVKDVSLPRAAPDRA